MKVHWIFRPKSSILQKYKGRCCQCPDQCLKTLFYIKFWRNDMSSTLSTSHSINITVICHVVLLLSTQHSRECLLWKQVTY